MPFAVCQHFEALGLRGRFALLRPSPGGCTASAVTLASIKWLSASSLPARVCETRSLLRLRPTPWTATTSDPALLLDPIPNELIDRAKHIVKNICMERALSLRSD